MHLSGSPVLLFDCHFTRPPSDRPPVRLASSSQILLVSNNRSVQVDRLVQTPPAASQDGLIGFQTRLATQSNPTLRVRDNRSVVISDFYNEQSDQHLVFEGAPDQPEGAVTIQGAKMHMFSQKPVFDIRNYAGQIYYGQSQFYIEPKEPRFVSEGTGAVRLILAGHFWYNTRPRFELTPAVKLTLLGNREVPDAGVDEEALSAMARALDDLRRLGELDLRLSCQR